MTEEGTFSHRSALLFLTFLAVEHRPSLLRVLRDIFSLHVRYIIVNTFVNHNAQLLVDRPSPLPPRSIAAWNANSGSANMAFEYR